MNKGKLIVIEGTDGSGKTTQTKLLIERLQKENIFAESLRFPQYEKNLFGALIRECLDGKHGDFTKIDAKITSVLYACDRFETMPQINKWLEEGKIIILDRYTSSNQIHQGGKLRNYTDMENGNNDRSEFIDWLGKMEYEKLGIKKPDLVFYLDMPLEVSIDLISKREGIADAADSDFEYLKNSKEAGKYMLERESFWEKVDCMDGDSLLNPGQIHEKIWGKVSSLIK